MIINDIYSMNNFKMKQKILHMIPNYVISYGYNTNMESA